ncbi:HEAT repeat domain-containing protein [Brasilonema bromeliae SPC951]|uniref:HEAT repeat domain-containing protein n=2 Tax=Bromeliae group (in: Brasilonema) TaxID=3398495 RepID=A0ABX1P2U1_9CYAN|nr:HEAT repeat domain-containing protein [Brasilonema bromeliae]NMG18660.1 HEAT repeat domain-containing protein [Brasilonema bromeliae SPC951]
MDIHEIKTALNNSDFQYRLKAIAALKDYTPEIAVPLLTSKLRDSEFLVRSFVAMGLGKQQTAESFAALLELMKFDNTPNVRAEAASSLSLFGRVAASHLVLTFFRDDHWLVRRSILAVLLDLECPEELFEVCIQALAGEDSSVQADAIDALGTFALTSLEEPALSQLLALVGSESKQIRIHVVHALKRFDHPQAKEALRQLRQDPDHQVVAAALENLLQQ